MLKGIPTILSPELLKILMEMGHGDEIAIVDGNYPAGGHAQHSVRCDGCGVVELLEAILRFFPIDTYVENPVSLMELAPGETYKPEIWDAFRLELDKAAPGLSGRIEMIPRMDFYLRVRGAYASVATGETARYANIILKKGVVVEEE